MTSQLIRVVTSFVFTIAIAFVYQMTIASWIEPEFDINTDTIEISPSAFLGQQKQKLTQFFPPRSWQLGPTKVLESNNVMLLMKDFREVGDNKLELEPLTIIAFETEEDPEKWQQPVVVLNADRAVLQFTELNLAFGKIGELVGGEMNGNVQITRKSADDSHEPLDIITSEVKLATDRIETRSDVQFLIGNHQGSGRHLIAQFEERPKTSQSRGPNFSGLSLLELVKVDRILLSTEGRGLLGNIAETPQSQSTTPNRMYASAPVEIRCNGPFVFDGKHRVATFRDQVKVQRLVASGKPDQLDADLLEVHFQKQSQTDSPDGQGVDAGEMNNLKLRKLVAVGTPFRLNARSVESTAKGNQLIYDLVQKRIEVVGSPVAELTKGAHRFRSPSLQYELAETPSFLGRVWAAGPGEFHGSLSPDSSSDQGYITWNHEFRIEPKNSEYVIAVEGQATVSIDGKGKIEGNQLYVWLQDVTPSGVSKQKLLPQRMQGVGRIEIDTPQFVGSANEIRAWFQFDTPQIQPASHLAEPAKLPVARINTRPASASPVQVAPAALTPVAPVTGQIQPSAPNAPQGPQSPAKPPSNRFRISGNQIQLVVRHDGKQSHLENATVSGNAQLAEIPQGEERVDPFMVRGDTVQLLNGSNKDAEIHVVGQPGIVSGRGSKIYSSNFRVNQLQGRVWGEGPGRFTFPLDRDFQGRKLAVPEYFEVEWQGGFSAQQNQITFLNAVKITGRQSRVTTAKLTITLDRNLDFQDTDNNRDIAAQKVECSGGVYLYNRNSQSGVVQSIDQFEGKSLSIDQQTGDIYAQGPGTAKSVLVGKANFNVPGMPSQNPTNPSQTGPALTFLKVDFVSHVTGNFLRKEISFHKVQQAVYGPVGGWEEEIGFDTPAEMRTTDISLKCDQLSVLQAGTDGEAEFLASGNSEIQGKMFHAWADRISYAATKQLLTLRGNGRNPVQLIHQRQIGGSRQTARAGTIMYWPEQRRLEVIDGKAVTSGLPEDIDPTRRIPGLR